MKKLGCLFLAIAILMAIMWGINSAPTFNEKSINGNTYKPYGLFNEEENKLDSIHYKISSSSIFLGIIFSETIIVPIWIAGYSLFEPVCLKKDFKPGSVGIKK